LLQAILAGHPDLLGHPSEPQFFLDLYERFGLVIRDTGKAHKYLSQHPRMPLSEKDLEKVFNGDRSISIQLFTERYLSIWAGEALQEKQLVLKHPRLTFFLDFVFHIFPDAIILHIVRDPRANVSSQRARWKNATLLECISWWEKSIAIGRQLARSQPQRYFEVVYEDLVTEPEKTLTELCAKLKIPYNSELVTIDFKAPAYAPDTSPQLKHYHRPDPSRLALWKQYLSPFEIRLIENRLHRQMAWWNYSLESPKVSNLQYTLRLAIEWIRHLVIWKVKGGFRKLGWRLGIGLYTYPVLREKQVGRGE
jgi:hypothetical protein